MKIYKFFIVLMSGLFIYSCTEPLNNPLEDINISVQSEDGVTVENNVITVTRNTPIKFNIIGEPDNITFYSGEKDHNYDFRNRTQIDPAQIKSSVMSFQIENQYFYQNPYYDAHVNLYSLYISETFPGLYKNDFEADCQLLSEFSDWQDWIPQDQLPQKPEKKDYELDFKKYLGKNITLAINYHPSNEDNDLLGQPKVHFRNFKIRNELLNGSVIEIYPSNMGFTPVNVWSSNLENVTVDETNLKKCDGYYENGKLIESALWYGSVTVDVWGMWNLKSASTGYFYIQSTTAGKGFRPSWLVSDYLVINSCDPDKGVPVKNIANRLNTYEYTYSEVGTYKAVFVLNNANYKDEDSRIITMVINVK